MNEEEEESQHWRPDPGHIFALDFEGCCSADTQIYEMSKFETIDFPYLANIVRVCSVTLTFGEEKVTIRVGDFNIHTQKVFLYGDCVSFRDDKKIDTTYLYLHFIESPESQGKV